MAACRTAQLSSPTARSSGWMALGLAGHRELVHREAAGGLLSAPEGLQGPLDVEAHCTLKTETSWARLSAC